MRNPFLEPTPKPAQKATPKAVLRADTAAAIKAGDDLTTGQDADLRRTIGERAATINDVARMVAPLLNRLNALEASNQSLSKALDNLQQQKSAAIILEKEPGYEFQSSRGH